MDHYELYKNDYLHWDVTELVDVTFRRSAGDTSETGVTALRTDLDRLQAVFGFGAVPAESIGFYLPDVLLDGEKISSGDKITDADGVSYYVVTARKVSFGTQWVCQTRQEAI